MQMFLVATAEGLLPSAPSGYNRHRWPGRKEGIGYVNKVVEQRSQQAETVLE
jgi:hypothetical protein